MGPRRPQRSSETRSSTDDPEAALLPPGALRSDNKARESVFETIDRVLTTFADSIVPLPPPRRDEEDERRGPRALQPRAAASALHAVSVGLVQLSDYGSDLVSLMIFHQAGLQTFFYIGAGCVASSVLLAVPLGLGLGPGVGAMFQMPTRREKLLFTLLTPLNLHTMYAGLLLARDEAAPADERLTHRIRCLRQCFVFYKLMETCVGA